MPRALLFAIPLLLFGALAAGCSQSIMMTGTMAYAPEDGSKAGCKVNAGTYHLPKRLVSVRVGGTSSSYSIAVDGDKLVSDADETFCLDFVYSFVSEDRIGIQRTPDQLLQRIYTYANDRTKPIAEAMIRATGELVAASIAGGLANRNAEQQIADAANYATLSYDPFDRREAEEVNRALRPFGYCLYLDNRDDPYVPDWSPGLCGRGSAVKDPDPGYYQTEYRKARQLMQRGVLYRQELSHRLVVMRKNDPGNPREPWHLAATEYLQMPNRAPIFALGINRAFLVTAETDVVFENGLLKNITVLRPSELNAFVDLPLYAARVALSVPAMTLRIFENEKENREALWQTNAELIQTLRKMRHDMLADEAVRQGELRASDRLLVGDGSASAGGPVLAGRSGDRTPASIERLGSCLDDEAINATPEGRASCFEIMTAGD